jgi:hypothetical protein
MSLILVSGLRQYSMPEDELRSAQNPVVLGDRQFVFQNTAVLQLKKHFAGVGFHNESGGTLLGSKCLSGEMYEIVSFTLPTKYNKAGPTHFIRNARISNRRIARAWQKGGSTVNYIGEWHSHNQGFPNTSHVDINLMRSVS